MTFKKPATTGCLSWKPVEEFKGDFGGRIRIADGWIGVREMECVCMCVCWGTGDIYKDRVPLVP